MITFKVHARPYGDPPAEGEQIWLGEGGKPVEEARAVAFTFRSGETGLDKHHIDMRVREIAGLFAGNSLAPNKVYALLSKTLRALQSQMEAGIRHYATRDAAAAGAQIGSEEALAPWVRVVERDLTDARYDAPWQSVDGAGNVVTVDGLATLDSQSSLLLRDLRMWEAWARWERMAHEVPDGWKSPLTCPYWGWWGDAAMAAWVKAMGEVRQGKSTPLDS